MPVDHTHMPMEMTTEVNSTPGKMQNYALISLYLPCLCGYQTAVQTKVGLKDTLDDTMADELIQTLSEAAVALHFLHEKRVRCSTS
ncbi:hypothetical protein SEA_ODESZA_81 [Gordonia Phage Odesza]|uniref:Uncharacterized protein n=5 Tax=Tanisvirus tanis TaxID=2844677 RepID=A0A7D5K6E6_9CAUD|nr:hypothetical protein HWC73_gp82 [Gordonia phage Tanis]AVO25320.1 hypothetical protein PBI_GRAVY_81 [Gordonia phage Gravy]AVO25413.1 hypothetical protein PBI_KERRY_81 [Gordonia phage Kerry]QGJ89690.1 hypothetical protein SEA_ODESZA_81 [Gordonia Phage Odesza]QKY78751.1 hypothetical protein SEA_GILL_82 [Gordonia phage Gill]QLF83797.1 hypothetical protein SEA_MAGEL_83 [Gordonia phage Magel]QYW00719.1 hypothetical protein SEA_RONEY_81 [Gordonia phage Roney]